MSYFAKMSWSHDLSALSVWYPVSVTAKRNLEWEGGGMVERQKRDPSRGVRANWLRGNFENWNFGNAISCDLVIKF